TSYPDGVVRARLLPLTGLLRHRHHPLCTSPVDQSSPARPRARPATTQSPSHFPGQRRCAASGPPPCVSYLIAAQLHGVATRVVVCGAVLHTRGEFAPEWCVVASGSVRFRAATVRREAESGRR